MKNKIDLLMINGISRRQHSISDTALENSLAIIRSHLESAGFEVEIVDYQKLDQLEAGVPRMLLSILRFLVWLQSITYHRLKILFSLFFVAAMPFHTLSLNFKDKYLERQITRIIKDIETYNVKLIGIKAWYGDSFIWSEKLANSIRASFPETIIIIGGPQVNVYGESVLENNCFDIAVSGPAENLIKQLIISSRSFSNKESYLAHISDEYGSRFIKCDSISFLNSENQLTKTIPHYRPEDFKGKLLFHTIVDGVGCGWNRCAFCSHPTIHSHYFPRNVNEIINEMIILNKKGIKHFRFSSSDTPLSQAGKIAQAILDSGLKIKFSMFTRASVNCEKDYEVYCTLIKAGLKAIFMGGETGHDQINLLVMNKGLKKSNIIQSINMIHQASLKVGERCFVGLSLIYPCPVIEGVTLNDIFKENIDLIEKSRPDSVLISPPSPFPNTEWFNNHIKFGFEFAPDFISTLMRYEYTNFKPTESWAPLSIRLNNMDLRTILAETSKLRNYITHLGIPTDFTDEYFMMAEALGCKSQKDFRLFKSKALIDIMSGTVGFTNKICKAMIRD